MGKLATVSPSVANVAPCHKGGDVSFVSRSLFAPLGFLRPCRLGEITVLTFADITLTSVKMKTHGVTTNRLGHCVFGLKLSET